MTTQVPFSSLVLYHQQIGIHRGRTVGLRDLFGYRTLRGVPFLDLARRVRDAYEGRSVPKRDGWLEQREALRWFVERGRDGICALRHRPCVREIHARRYEFLDGHHRALALHILGENSIQAHVKHGSTYRRISSGR